MLWQVATLVPCLTVLVLGMGTALAYLVLSDSSAASGRDDSPEPAGAVRTSQRRADQPTPCDQALRALRQGAPSIIAHAPRGRRTRLWSCLVLAG
jgi:hypothetical protein